MTSADDIELIRRGYTAWNAGDLDGLVAVMSEDIEVHPVLGDQVSADTFTGHDGIRHWREAIFESLGELSVEIVDIEVGKGGRYLALLRFTGTGRASGAAVSLDASHLLTVENGLLVSLVGYQSWAAGRAAL